MGFGVGVGVGVGFGVTVGFGYGHLGLQGGLPVTWCFNDHGPWVMHPGSWGQHHGAWAFCDGDCVLVLETRTLKDLGVWDLSPGLKVLGPPPNFDSETEDRGCVRSQ